MNNSIRLTKLIAAFTAAVCLSGCLSVARIAKLDCANGVHKWDPVKQEYVWQKCNGAMVDPLAQFGLLPTMKMRWQMLRLTWNWAPPKYKLQRRTALPAALLLLTPGIILDLPCDIVALPWDWKYRTNSCDVVERELPERVLRSSCVVCGAVSDGHFSLVRSATPSSSSVDCERHECCASGGYWDESTSECISQLATPDALYGICPNCATNALSLGYEFAD